MHAREVVLDSPLELYKQHVNRLGVLFGKTCSLRRGDFIGEDHQTFIYLMYWSLNRVEKINEKFKTFYNENFKQVSQVYK